jgi:hypothetical protein
MVTVLNCKMRVYLYARKSGCMKKGLFFIALFVSILYWAGCKKCYSCQNSCKLCTLTISNHAFTQTICRDSFATEASYQAALAADSADGYVCTATSPTYSRDYCVNQPGDKSYLDYYNQGGRATCTPK